MTTSASSKALRLALDSPAGPSSPKPMMVNHGVFESGASDMSHSLLVLGGTTEASALCRALAERQDRAIVSLAGRVANPKPLPLPTRVGGFGGVAGLRDYIRNEGITHVIDATHPFADQMSRNAIAACIETNTPLCALTRAPWQAQDGDIWHHVPDISGAVAALQGEAKRVFLAVGRMHLDDFAPNPQHHYVLRLVDAPDALPFPKAQAIIARGPFGFDEDCALLRDHRIDLIVSKNSGGTGARAKIDAARHLGLPIVMIDRPILPPRTETHSVQGVLDWLDHSGVNRGV